MNVRGNVGFGSLGLWAGSLLLLFLASGCLGRSPEVHHFVLGTELSSPASGESGAGLEGDASSQPSVLVGPVRLPSYLERAQMARLEAGGEIELDEFNRWLGGFEQNFLRALSLGIAGRLPSDRVVAYPSKAPFALDYRVRLHVDDLIAEESEQLRVRIRWALIAEGAGEESDPGPAELFVIQETIPIEGGSGKALVAAHDQALASVAGRIAKAIQEHAARP